MKKYQHNGVDFRVQGGHIYMIVHLPGYSREAMHIEVKQIGDHPPSYGYKLASYKIGEPPTKYDNAPTTAQQALDDACEILIRNQKEHLEPTQEQSLGQELKNLLESLENEPPAS